MQEREDVVAQGSGVYRQTREFVFSFFKVGNDALLTALCHIVARVDGHNVIDFFGF